MDLPPKFVKKVVPHLNGSKKCLPPNYVKKVVPHLNLTKKGFNPLNFSKKVVPHLKPLNFSITYPNFVNLL